MNYNRYISKMLFDSFLNILLLRCRDNIDEFLKSCFTSENKPGEKKQCII